MSKIYKKPPQCKDLEDHQKYLSRIRKTLYYGRLPNTEMLSLPVTELAAEMFSEVQKGKSLERLHWDTAAEISYSAAVSPVSFVLALLYFERLKICNPEYLERTSPTDLFLVSLMISSKFLFDDGECDEVFMDNWASSAGISCKDLIQQEKEFLLAIDWKIFVNELSFYKKLNEIEKTLAEKQGNFRGYFTYSELQVLLSVVDIYNLVQCVVAVSVILAATYTAGLLTIAGSVFLVSQVPGTSLYVKKLDNQQVALVPCGYVNDGSQIVENDAIHLESENLQTKVDVFTKCNSTSNMNVLKMFKAGILLASIKSDSPVNESDSRTETDANTNCQSVTFDWWNVPAMKWLAKTSELVAKIDQFELPGLKNYIYFLENRAVNSKHIFLEDYIQKATKTRIQDQIESSWHSEWTDSLRYHVYYYQILPYLHNIKS